MFEKVRFLLDKKLPDALGWVLLIITFTIVFFLIFLGLNIIKLSGFTVKNNHWIQGSKYIITSVGCKLINGYFYDSYDWNGRYSCTSYYSDAGKNCQNSNQCKGVCVLIEPKIEGNTDYKPSNELILQKFDCKGVGKDQVWKIGKESQTIYNKYNCKIGLFRGTCSSLPWEGNNRWELNNNEINYLEAIEAI
jgi:hypothetical protein